MFHTFYGDRFCALAKIAMAWVLALTILMSAKPVIARDTQDINKVLSLSQAIQKTLSENPTLDIFAFHQQALDGAQSTAELKPSYALGIELDNFAGSDKLQGFDSSELTVSLSSVIEMGGKRDARMNLVNSKRPITNLKKELQALRLLSETTRRYGALLAEQERVILAQEAVSLTENALTVVKTRARAGATTNAEVKRAKAAFAQSQLTLKNEQKRLALLQFDLASMWGATRVDFDKVSGNLYQSNPDLAFEQLILALENNPQIRLFAAEERLKQAELSLAQTESSSDLNWSVGFTQARDTNDVGFKAGVSMNLFSDSRNSGAIRSTQARKSALYVSKKAALVNIRNQLYRAYSNRKQSKATVETLQSNIVPFLEQALNETRQAYQRGRYSYLEYVSARQELIIAKRKLIDAASAVITYGAILEELTAEPLKTTSFKQGTEQDLDYE